MARVYEGSGAFALSGNGRMGTLRAEVIVVSRKDFDRVSALADRLAALIPAPRRSHQERAVYDAWEAALKPRARPMVRRAERLADARNWEFDAQREPVRLRAAFWSAATREIAYLHAELVGALTQHERVRIVWRPKTRFGVTRGSNAPVLTTKEKAKAKAAQAKALQSARKADMKAAKEVLDDLLERLEVVRKELRALRQEVRHVVARLQAVEEERLVERTRQLREGSAEREEAEDLLVRLAQGRLNAERHRDPQASGYGLLLRRGWLQPRARLVRLLEG